MKMPIRNSFLIDTPTERYLSQRLKGEQWNIYYNAYNGFFILWHVEELAQPQSRLLRSSRFDNTS